jgi:hypothetical protein
MIFSELDRLLTIMVGIKFHVGKEFASARPLIGITAIIITS